MDCNKDDSTYDLTFYCCELLNLHISCLNQLFVIANLFNLLSYGNRQARKIIKVLIGTFIHVLGFGFCPTHETRDDSNKKICMFMFQTQFCGLAEMYLIIYDDSFTWLVIFSYNKKI